MLSRSSIADIFCGFRAPLGYLVLEEWWEGRAKRVLLEWTECLGRTACLGCW